MTNLRATIMHHSISRARIVDLGTTNLTLAKRRATAEFGGGYHDHLICILGEETRWNPTGVIARKRVAGDRWYNDSDI